MSPKVLITAEHLQHDIEDFRPVFEDRGIEIVLPPAHHRLEEEELLDWVADVHGVIIGDDRFTARVLRNAPNLEVISRWGTGVDNIDLEVCRELGITVKNVPYAFTTAVADTVLAFMLTFARRVPWCDQTVRAGRWETLPARTLQESTLGIIGVGRIGREVAKRAAAFDMTILGNDIKEIPEVVKDRTGLKSMAKETIYNEADFISLNCDLNPSSAGMIGGEQLQQMKSDSVLINTARGGLIHEEALAAALQNGTIAGAGLDVFVSEPLPEDSPLRKLDNVLLAPHNGHSSPMTRRYTHQQSVNNLLESLAS